MMKKRFTFLAALTVTLSFIFAAACGGGNTSSSIQSSLPDSSSSISVSTEENSSSVEDSSMGNSSATSGDGSVDSSVDNSLDDSANSSGEEDISYTIYYFLIETDETECKLQIVGMGETYTLTTNVQREGYVFSYWKDKETGERYYPQNGEWIWSKEEDMRLVAVWALDWNANPNIKDDDKWSDFYV